MRGEVPAPRPAWTLQEAHDVAYKVAWADSKGERTTLINARDVLEFFGPDRKLDTIDMEAIDEFVEHLEETGRSNATINRKLAALSKMLSVAHARGGLQGKPKIPRKREGKGRIRFLTPDEEAALLQLFRQWGYESEAEDVMVLIDTGLRTGEYVRLVGRDFDRERRLLHIWENKADYPRSVPLTERSFDVMMRRFRRYGFGRLVPKPVDWLRRPWNRAKVTMGLEHDEQFVPHALRHTCASRLVQRGVPLKVVQEWMGHKTIQVTLKYAHLAPTNLLEAVKVLEQPTLRVVEAA